MTSQYSTLRPLLLCTLILLTALGACAQDVDVDAQDEPLDGLPDWAQTLRSGKADDASGLTVEMGALGLGEAAALTQTFEGSARVHIYTLTLAQGDTVSFETTQKGSNRGIDTSLFLFAPQTTLGAAVDLIASDGDSGWGKLSRIESFMAPEQGIYTLWVMKENTTSANRYRLQADCLSDTCGASLPVLDTDACVFGPTMSHVLEALGPVRVIQSKRLGLLDPLSPLEARQLIAAVHTTYEDVTTTAQAFESVDQQEIYRLELWDTSSRQAFVAFRFWAGDNPYGAILRPEDETIVAKIQDDSVASCTQAWGPEQHLCAQTSECGMSQRCSGLSEGQGTCLDTAASAPAGLGDACDTTAACGTPALVCAGETVNAGYCVETWMRRGFHSIDALTGEPIPDGTGSLSIPVNVFGLATVSTDVRVTMRIDHNAPKTLRVTLTNPDGTQVVLHDGSSDSLYLNNVPVIGYPGDERANGIWTLDVNDDTVGTQGYLSHFTLEVTSRYD